MANVFYPFYLPLLRILLSFWECDENGNNTIVNDIKCYSGIFYLYGCIGIICSLILIVFTYFFTITFYHNNLFSTNQANIKISSTQDLHLLICKTIGVVIHIFVVNEHSSLSQWIVGVIYIMLSFFSFYTYYSGRNYINQTLLRLMLITLAINVWANVVLIINKALETTQYSGGLGLFFMGDILIIICLCLMEMSYLTIDYLCKTDLNQAETLRKINLLLAFIEDEKIDRSKELVLKGYIYLYEENCPTVNCPLKRLLQHEGDIKDQIKNLLLHIEVLFLKAIDKYPTDTRIRISYAFFLLMRLKKKYHAIIQLENVENLKSTLEDEFLQYKFRKYLNDYDDQLLLKSKTERNDTIIFKKEFLTFKSKIKKVSLTYSEFWSVLLFSNKSEIEHLNKIGKEISNGMKEIKEIFSLLQKINPNDKNTLVFYIDYLLCVANDKENGRKYKQILYNSNRSEKDISNYLNKPNEIFSITPTNIVTSDVNQYLVCSSQPESFGVITNISLGLCLMLGFRRNDLIGKKYDIIMPDLFIKRHTDLLVKTAEGYRKEIVDLIYEGDKMEKVTKMVFLINKSKYLVPITLQVGIIPNEAFDFSFLAKVVLTDTNLNESGNFQNDCYVMTNSDFVIQYFTSNAITLLGLNSNFINGNLSITDFIKEFTEEFLKFSNEYDISTNEQRVLLRAKIIKTRFKDKKRIITWRKNDFVMRASQIMKKAQGTSSTSLILMGAFQSKQENDNTTMNNNNNILTTHVSNMNINLENPKFIMNVKEYKIMNVTVCYVFKLSNESPTNLMITPRNKSQFIREGNHNFKEGQEISVLYTNNNLSNSISPIPSNYGVGITLGLSKNFIPPNFSEFQLDVDNLSYKFNFVKSNAGKDNGDDKQSSIEEKRSKMREMVLNRLKELEPNHTFEDDEEEEEEDDDEDDDDENYSSNNNDDGSYSHSDNNSGSSVDNYNNNHNKDNDSHNDNESTNSKNKKYENTVEVIKKFTKFQNVRNRTKSTKSFKFTSKDQNLFQLPTNLNKNEEESYYHVDLKKIKFSIYDFATRGFIQDTTFEYISEVEKKTTAEKDVTTNINKTSKDKGGSKTSSTNIQNYFSNVYNNYNPINSSGSMGTNSFDMNHVMFIQKKIEESLQKQETQPTIINVRKASALTMIVLIGIGLAFIFLFDYSVDVIKENIFIIENSNKILQQFLIGQFYTRELTLLRNDKYTNFQGVKREDKVTATQANILNIYNLTHNYLQRLIITDTPFSSRNSKMISNDNVTVYSIDHNFNISSFTVNIHTGIEHVNNALFFISTLDFNSLIPTNKHVFRYLRNSFNSIYTGLEDLKNVYFDQLTNIINKCALLISLAYGVCLILLVVCFIALRITISKVIAKKESYLEVFFDINKRIIQTFLDNCETFNKKIIDDVSDSANMSAGSLSLSEDIYYDNLINGANSLSPGINEHDKGNSHSMNKLHKKRNINQSSNQSYNNKTTKKSSRSLLMASIKVLFAFICVGSFLSIIFALYIIYSTNTQSNVKLSDDILGLLRVCYIFYNSLREYIFDVTNPVYGMKPDGFSEELSSQIYSKITQKEAKVYKVLPKISNTIVNKFNAMNQGSVCRFMDRIFTDPSSNLTCETFMFGAAQFGLKTFITTYIEEIHYMKNLFTIYVHEQTLYNYTYNLTLTGTTEYTNLMPDNTDEHELYHSLNQINVLNWEKTREINYGLLSIIDPAFNEFVNYLQETIDTHIHNDKKTLIWLTIGLIIFNMFWFFTFFVPFINGLSQTIYKAKNMLSIIPKQVLFNVPNILNVLNIEVNTIIRNS